jgi:hypothetical protein
MLELLQNIVLFYQTLGTNNGTKSLPEDESTLDSHSGEVLVPLLVPIV